MLNFVNINFNKLILLIGAIGNPNLISYFNIENVTPVVENDIILGYRFNLSKIDNFSTGYSFELDKRYSVRFLKKSDNNNKIFTISSNSLSVKPDNNIVVDNEDGTYEIIDFRNQNELKLSQFVSDIKGGLEYLNVTVTDNILSEPSVDFTQEDVGKLITLKKSYINPDVSDGTEIINTSLGRIVSPTVKIVSVDVDNNKLYYLVQEKAYEVTRYSISLDLALELGIIKLEPLLKIHDKNN